VAVCYSIYLSTDSDHDLSIGNSDLVRFKQESIPEPYHSQLRHPNQWYVGSKSGCSCTFRHLYSVELGFGEPVEWYEEDEPEIAATFIFIQVIRQILIQGFQVDCIDTWEGTQPEEIIEISVNLDDIGDEQFRFFENHHFLFESRVVQD
jgi:hypothetical protein